MKNSKLNLNSDKIKFLIIGISMQHAKCDGFFPTHILSQNIIPAALTFKLGITFDKNINFKQHISETCRFSISYPQSYVKNCLTRLEYVSQASASIIILSLSGAVHRMSV